MYRIILSSLLLLLGAALTAGGIWLAALGGSWYYLIAGLAIAISGGLLMARRTDGLVLYAVTLFATLIWAVWEAGFDWWALSARGSLLVILGILLLLPPMVRSLHRAGRAAPRLRRAERHPAAGLADFRRYGRLFVVRRTARDRRLLRQCAHERERRYQDRRRALTGNGRPTDARPMAAAIRRSPRSRPKTSPTCRSPGPTRPGRSAERTILARRLTRSRLWSSTIRCMSARRLRPSSRSIR